MGSPGFPSALPKEGTLPFTPRAFLTDLKLREAFSTWLHHTDADLLLSYPPTPPLSLWTPTLARLPSTRRRGKGRLAGRLQIDLRRLDHECRGLPPRSTLLEGGETQAFGALQIQEPLLQLPPVFWTTLGDTQGLVLGLTQALRAAQIHRQDLHTYAVLPQTLELAQISGQLWVSTLGAASRLDRADWLLRHAYRAKNLPLPPLKPIEHSVQRPLKFQGGYVLTPQRGLHRAPPALLLVDFASLYPSLICEFDVGRPRGLLAPLFRSLMARRRRAAASRDDHGVRAQSLKLVANALYGALGSPHSMFYDRETAGEITRRGRSLLQGVARQAEGEGFRVLYGDTDSLLLQSPSYFKGEEGSKNESMEFGKTQGRILCEKINRSFREIRLRLQGVFRAVLLMRKKVYVGVPWEIDSKTPDVDLKVNEDDQPWERAGWELKGLELIRREGSLWGKRAAWGLLRILLNSPKEGQECTGENLWNTAIAELHNPQTPRSDFLLQKTLRRGLESYPSRLNKGGGGETPSTGRGAFGSKSRGSFCRGKG